MHDRLTRWHVCVRPCHVCDCRVYTIKYNLVDSCGNTRKSLSRYVNIPNAKQSHSGCLNPTVVRRRLLFAEEDTMFDEDTPLASFGAGVMTTYSSTFLGTLAAVSAAVVVAVVLLCKRLFVKQSATTAADARMLV